MSTVPLIVFIHENMKMLVKLLFWEKRNLHKEKWKILITVCKKTKEKVNVLAKMGKLTETAEKPGSSLTNHF